MTPSAVVVDMLSNADLQLIAQALSSIRAEGQGAGAWLSLGALADLGARNVDVTIDVRATKDVGAPVVIVRPRAQVADVLARLSAREQEVALAVAAGLSNKDIARALKIAVGTVKDHVHHILGKCAVSSRGQLAALLHGSQARAHTGSSVVAGQSIIR
jgi:two-component system, NarL family, nitrate/nitrite response regulator NarL